MYSMYDNIMYVCSKYHSTHTYGCYLRDNNLFLVAKYLWYEHRNPMCLLYKCHLAERSRENFRTILNSIDEVSDESVISQSPPLP